MSNIREKVRPGKLFLIVGPSGSGKGSVISELKKRHPKFVFPISCTTREPRPTEKDGEVYHFVSRTEFEKGIKSGDFLEWAEVHKNHYYGTPKAPIFDALAFGKTVVREVDIQGFHSIKAIVPRAELISIFLVVKDLDELKMRILKRGKLPDEEIARRMESAKSEIAQSMDCDYCIDSPHGQIPKIVRAVEDIIAVHT